MKNNQARLRGELHQAGAKNDEIDRLVATASQLGSLKKTVLTPEAGSRTLWRRGAAFASIGLAGLIVGAGIITYAQSSLPNSWLYPAKRLSEKVVLTADPDYRTTLMMRRAQEVKQLAAERADSHTVLATLAAYKTEAAIVYASPKTSNYAALEYCKDNLEQAAASASGPERHAIIEAVASLPKTD